jgi:hypothetical protein
MMVFSKATIVIPVFDPSKRDYEYQCYNISQLDSPAVQRRLEDIEEYQYFKIANLGLLLVKDVVYTQCGGILFTCRKVRSYEQKQIQEEAPTPA